MSEIQYEDAMTDQATAVERLATELAAANAKVAELREVLKSEGYSIQ